MGRCSWREDDGLRRIDQLWTTGMSTLQILRLFWWWANVYQPIPIDQSEKPEKLFILCYGTSITTTTSALPLIRLNCPHLSSLRSDFILFEGRHLRTRSSRIAYLLRLPLPFPNSSSPRVTLPTTTKPLIIPRVPWHRSSTRPSLKILKLTSSVLSPSN
jgi:hypothetical protein